MHRGAFINLIYNYCIQAFNIKQHFIYSEGYKLYKLLVCL